MSRSPIICALKNFSCPENKTPFSDTCGCGCECNYDIQTDILYHSIDPGKCKWCADLNFACNEGTKRFDGSCGCGCDDDFNINPTANKFLVPEKNNCNYENNISKTYFSRDVAFCKTKKITRPTDASYFSDKCGCGCESIDKPSLTLYTAFPDWYLDCGREIQFPNDIGYNAKMRSCFLNAYKKCKPAKIYQKSLTRQGHTISQVAYTTGKTRDGFCEMKIFFDSRNHEGFEGKILTSCYSANIKTLHKNGTPNEKRDFLNINQCKQHDFTTFF